MSYEAWLQPGSTVRVRGEYGATWVGRCMNCWDFAIIRDAAGKDHHVMPAQVVKVLEGPPPAPPVPEGPRVFACKQCGNLHSQPMLHCPGAGGRCRGHLAPAQQSCLSCGLARPVPPAPSPNLSRVSYGPAVAPVTGTGPRCFKQGCVRPAVGLLAIAWYGPSGKGPAAWPPICAEHAEGADLLPFDAPLPVDRLARVVRRQRKPAQKPEIVLDDDSCRSPDVVNVTFVCLTVNESNVGGEGTHWPRRKRARAQKLATSVALEGSPPPKLPCRVTLRRLAFNNCDGDGLQSAMKAIRDATATWIACAKHDASPLVSWKYEQEIRRETTLVRTAKGPRSVAVGRVQIIVEPEGVGT